MAGNVFIFKAAGAAADLMLPLDEVERIARHANARSYTMGVALSACSLPQTRSPNFQRPAGEMEIGMGIHGEPGVRRGPLRPANEVADEIMDAILAEMQAAAGDNVAVPVNALGSTPLMELYILYARVAGCGWPVGAPGLGRALLHPGGDGRRLDHCDSPGRGIDPADRPFL